MNRVPYRVEIKKLRFEGETFVVCKIDDGHTITSVRTDNMTALLKFIREEVTV